MRIRYWSSDVCSSDLTGNVQEKLNNLNGRTPDFWSDVLSNPDWFGGVGGPAVIRLGEGAGANIPEDSITAKDIIAFGPGALNNAEDGRSEEHTSELQSLMRISYAVFCLKKKNKQKHTKQNPTPT